MSKKTKRGVSNTAVMKSGQVETPVQAVRLPDLPDGVVPADGLAMDNAMVDTCHTFANHQGVNLMFRGYGRLAQLAQISEFRVPTQVLATEMTRQWIELKSTDGDRSEQIAAILSEMDRLKIRETIKQTIINDGFFGRGMIYVDLGDQSNDQNPLILSPKTIKIGSLQGFKAIEPFWTTPANYNATDPTRPDFYKATMWFVMGKQVHASRIPAVISQPVPDMLKPAYNFGGISTTQLLEPYVDSWLRTRLAISDLVKSFSISGLKTDMQTILQGKDNGDDLINRATLFNQMRDNRNLMLMDKDTEEFFQFNTPLSGLDALQAQALEQMVAPVQMPLVKRFGITPTGLNASSEGEVKVWYDHVKAMQEALLTDPLVWMLKIIQLSLFGEIYDDITFEYCPLEQMNELEQANIQKAKADTGAVLIESGVISNDEERERIKADPHSGYNALEGGAIEAQDPETNPEE